MASIDSSGIPITYDSQLAFTPNIFITLPGRALNFIEKGVAIVDHCKMLVLDEADKLLYQDYDLVIENLADALPQHQTLMLFDTFTVGVSDFACGFLDKAFEHELMNVNGLFVEIYFYFFRHNLLKRCNALLSTSKRVVISWQ